MNTAKALTQSSSKGIPFDILRAYGIGDDIIDIWKKSYGEFLLPIQEKAIVKHNVLGGRTLSSLLRHLPEKPWSARSFRFTTPWPRNEHFISCP